jgi:uncharacterized repeat protein (TIGR01451 family)
VTDSIVQQFTFGLYLGGHDAQIRRNLFRDNTRLFDQGGLNRGVDVYADGTHAAPGVRVTSNVFANPVRYGVVLQGQVGRETGGTVARNVIRKTANRNAGMLLLGWADLTVADNLITGPDTTDPLDVFGLWIDRQQGLHVHGNTFTGLAAGVFIADTLPAIFGPPGLTANLNHNRIAGNTDALRIVAPYPSASAPVVITADQNWWGANGGPGATGGRPGVAQPANDIQYMDAGENPIPPPVVGGVTAAAPLQLTCAMPAAVTADTPVNLTGQVVGMPAYDRDAQTPLWFQIARTPIMGGTITGVTGDVFGFGRPPSDGFSVGQVLPGGGSLTGTLVAAAAGTGAGHVDLDNERASCPFTVAAADISIDKDSTTRRAVPGGVLRYRITVENRGTAPVRRLRVCDRFPRALEFVGATPKVTRVKGRRVCRTLRVLAAAGSRTLRLTFRLRAGVATDVVTNDATADTDNSNNANTARNNRRRRHGGAVEAVTVRRRAAACPASVHPVARAAC